MEHHGTLVWICCRDDMRLRLRLTPGAWSGPARLPWPGTHTLQTRWGSGVSWAVQEPASCVLQATSDIVALISPTSVTQIMVDLAPPNPKCSSPKEDVRPQSNVKAVRLTVAGRKRGGWSRLCELAALQRICRYAIGHCMQDVNIRKELRRLSLARPCPNIQCDMCQSYRRH